MDPYHWQIIVQFVWFTSPTHLATIPILRAQLYTVEDSRGQLHNAEDTEGHLYSSAATVSKFSVYFRATLMTLVLAKLGSLIVFPLANKRFDTDI